MQVRSFNSQELRRIAVCGGHSVTHGRFLVVHIPQVLNEARRALPVAVPSRQMIFCSLLLCSLAGLHKTKATSYSDSGLFVLADWILGRIGKTLLSASSDRGMATEPRKRVTLIFWDRIGTAVQRVIFAILVAPWASILAVTFLPVVPWVLSFLMYALMANQAML